VENHDDPEWYVRRILVNRNIRVWRGQRRETLIFDMPANYRQPDSLLTAPAGRDGARWARVCALPPRQRTAIVLRHYEDMSDTQVAATLGSAVRTVQSQTARALAMLRRDEVAVTETAPVDVVRV
jgi:DNA-directed RNA polymerase specialized sigma24 family protein